MGFGGMIKTAFDNKNTVVYSTNDWNSPIDTEWDDFLTFVPEFEGSVFTEKDDYKKKVKYPLLSCGISYKNSSDYWNDSIVLYLLSYIRIEHQISDLIEQFIDFYDINANEIVECITKA